MFTPEVVVLCTAAASIAFVHTLLGPDHYMPFVALSRSRGWSLGKTVRVTLFCGAGHIVGSVILGVLGLYIGIQLNVLEWVESARGDLAAWALVAFGLVYMSWGIRHAWRQRPHAHWHSHDGVSQSHANANSAAQAHPHTEPDAAAEKSERRTLIGWAIFIIFVLGPCEPLIPLLMFPAARESLPALLAVTGIFAVVTVATMLSAVVAGFWGARSLRWPGLARFGQAIAGGIILGCGLGIAVLGL
ncbi:hypothetical protein [Chromatocurvus halotolerans]|uniref:Urease accessory protein UreH-like transmembrane domain-containing protein n=1 Tax=Chromatocurvus halotolerans TaxID=1132028 RepID=A0A4R2KSX7_9GAMM|nr:hypothetical protein [Chromatocurvus halotolerans]TCO75902.1 hypothetical protein EV688_10693 [Chromatocurvus halotolerans]